MAEPAPNQFKYPALYSPGQIAFNDSAELSQLISIFGGPAMQGLAGAGNFLPHMSQSQGRMDQYMARQYQNQANASAIYMSGAGNQDVAKRLLAARTGVTDDPASDLNKAQAEQFASLLNNPATKTIAGMLIGPENLEAALHGRKGDVAALNQVANRVGFFRNDPSGSKRMDANSLEDFSRGVYAHLYDEGGNLSGAEEGARLAGAVTKNTAEYNDDKDVKALKKYANMENKTVVSDEEVTDRVMKRIETKGLSDDDVSTVYKKYISGKEKDTTKQVEALAKSDLAIKELNQTAADKSADKKGILQENEVTVDKTVTQAREQRLGQMNGFMAGQVGQMTERMFQRGMLPQAVGAMTPAERVKLLSKEGRLDDPETMQRLAEEFGHRDLMARDTEYANMTPEKQRKKLADRVGGYKEKLNDVLTAADDFNANPQKAKKSVQDIEKMEGFDAVAGNVDAKRSAAAIKKYTGAVAAVREIFGENGNPNAPMPALMAALDHLSQGASAQMDPKQIETALRSMQQMARESGIGFEQMAGMAAQMGATGDMLGLSKSQTMHNQVNAIAMVKTMHDSGAFSRPLFGAMTQPEATQFVGQKIQEGAASNNAKTMSALAGIYKADKTAFEPDSEFAKAMEAYTNPASGGKYTTTGPDGKPVEKNIFEVVGREGPQGLQRMFKAANGNESHLAAAFRNPASQQFADPLAGFQSQRYEMLRDINNRAVSGTLHTKLQDANKKAPPGSELAKLDAGATADHTGQAISELILESSGMQVDEQLDYIRTEMIPTLKESFKKNGVTDDAEAGRLAQQAATAYMGADASKQRGEIKHLVDETGAFVHAQSGMSMAVAYNTYGNGMPAKSAKEARKARNVAERKAAVGLNFSSSSPLARMSDYLLRVGERGEKVTGTGLFTALTDAVPDKDLRDRYTKGMEGGISSIQNAINEMTVTEQGVRDLEKNNDLPALKKLAGVDAETTIVSEADFAARRNVKMTESLKDDKKVTQEFKRIFGKENTTLSIEQQRKNLMDDKRFQTEHSSDILADGELRHADLIEGALQRGVGSLAPIAPLPGETPEQTAARQQEREHKLENLKTIRSSFFAGANESALGAGVSAVLDLVGVDKTQTNDRGQSIATELTELIGSGNYDSDPEKDDAHKTALANKVSQLVSDSGFALTNEQKEHVGKLLETQRVGQGIDAGGVVGQIQQSALQQIANASIEADRVTINASGIDGAGDAAAGTGSPPPAAPASDAEADKPVAAAITPAPPADGKTDEAGKPPARDPAKTDAAGRASGASQAAGQASAAAQGATAATQTVAPAPTAPAAGSAGQQAMTVSGELRITNLEAGILEVMNKNAPPIQAEGNGAPFAGSC